MRREDLGLAGYRDESSAFVRSLWVTVSIRPSYARSHRVAGGVAGLPSDRSGWCAYSRLVAAFRSIRLGRDVPLHRNGSFQQDEIRSGTDDPVIFSAPPADRLHHWCFGTSRSGGIGAPAISQACGHLSHGAPRRDVRRQCKCGTARRYTARQTANPALVADPDADFVYCATLVVNSRLNGITHRQADSRNLLLCTQYLLTTQYADVTRQNGNRTGVPSCVVAGL